MKKLFSSIKTFALLVSFIVIYSEVSAQNDSLKTFTANKTKPCKADSNTEYLLNITNGMFNNFYQNPGYCGFNQTFCYKNGCNIEIPFYKVDQGGFHPYSFFASFETNAGKRKSSGFGSCFIKLTEGHSIRRIFNNTYSYRIRIGKYNDLRLGLSFKIIEDIIDWRSLTFGDMIDSRAGFVYYTNEIPPAKTTHFSWNLDAGLIFSRKQFYIAFSGLNLCKPLKNTVTGNDFFKHIDNSNSVLILSGGYTKRITPNIVISPTAQIRFFGKQFSADVHVTGIFWKHLISGVSLNKLSTISADLGYSFRNIFVFYASAGVSANSELYNHFGPLDYISANIWLQLGKFR
jgi:type IX secretion system PorP/SprF family membrane protein